MSTPPLTLSTARLELRPFTLADAPFIIELLNDASFLGNIGDRGVRTLADAENYLQNGPLKGYREHGFGLSAIVARADQTVVGMAGILRRPSLPEPDLGYALLPQYTGRGYAFEAAEAWVDAGRTHFALRQLLAIVIAHNKASIQLLEKLGFVRDHAATPDASEPNLFQYRLQY
jgi:[ribosomal protein S5]-alanine N-acetyltransferase